MEQTEDIKYIIKKDGVKYPVRRDRRRFFFPDEWKKFICATKGAYKNLYLFIFNTGSRFDEAINIRKMDFDFERNNVRLWKTKTKAKKGETHGKPRTISLSSEFTRKMKKLTNNLQPEEYVFVSKMFVPLKIQNVNLNMKRVLKKLGIKDYWNFSTHNIRKTHGMYLKALGIDIGEICTRLGHDYNTYISHYGSADVFSDRDMRIIKELIGDLYMRQRRF